MNILRYILSFIFKKLAFICLTFCSKNLNISIAIALVVDKYTVRILTVYRPYIYLTYSSLLLTFGLPHSTQLDIRIVVCGNQGR